MKKQTKKNHFSPVFANQHWTNEENGWHYKYYYYCPHRKCVVDSHKDKGKTAWGYEFNLYSQELEDKLDTEIENNTAQIYDKLSNEETLNNDERMKWGQFIITQSMRTPSFFKYREELEKSSDVDNSFKEDIIGCQWCEDNKYIASRNWIILEAAEGDFFVRTDNPVYMTGFLHNPNTTIFYPLSPKKCFVACSFIEIQLALIGSKLPFPKQEVLKLEKGNAYKINFDLIKSASTSLIVAKNDNNNVISKMNLELLGAFPQIPYMLSSAENDYAESIKVEQLIQLMSCTDGIEYPEYRDYELKPFYGIEFSIGINPFSVFGVTNQQLKELNPDIEIEIE
ncbi:DUF4238 domain-containing protein [Shewanella sp. MMG014]|uniref:DUF4238 domain-containing protein n=1 Tax=Shewanella sp. MMG014 TaxID=2822691 RepID=UPI001B3966FC|nr:DUF4238 domain-containing protein [Shewanella sp. MMG014]MBQ4891255.1 DUF4238 domain-containing protein [Shewanella sp. MMG014]